ncbi:hypothetical protein BASA81_017379 [Batrachochytrium salamandrivorans]|nr:hypothetical protein BASA81_017379 [Batrachochytrium salamandrivorans]
MEIGENAICSQCTPLTPEQKYEMRFQQLVAFYQFWEPEKPDIEEHSRNLLTKHDFDHVVRALKTNDWTQIRSAYSERNTYNPLKSICNDTLPNSLQSKYGNCQTPLKTVLLNTGLDVDCVGTFSSILYSGLGSNPSTLANTLCNANLKDAITNNFCNALTVVGCPRAVEIIRFSPYANCYIVPLENRTTAYQLAYYANQDDFKCMRKYKVYPSAPERCEISFERAFLDYCPLPHGIRKECYSDYCYVCDWDRLFYLALGCIAYRFRRKSHLHHITRNEVLNQAVGNFVSFDQPLRPIPNCKL